MLMMLMTWRGQFTSNDAKGKIDDKDHLRLHEL